MKKKTLASSCTAMHSFSFSVFVEVLRYSALRLVPLPNRNGRDVNGICLCCSKQREKKIHLEKSTAICLSRDNVPVFIQFSTCLF